MKKVLGLGGSSFLILAASLALAGCGGDDDAENSTATASAEGVYGGTLTGSPNPNFQMVVLENGDAWALYGTQTATDFLVSGFIQASGASSNGIYAGSGKDYGYVPAVAGNVMATYNAGAKTINGTITSGSATVSFSGGPIAGSAYNYAQAADLNTVTGSWTLTALGGETVSLSIASSGSFTASGTSGCTFSGTIEPRASGKNVFDVSMHFGAAPCALANQNATGIGLAYPIAGGKTQFLFAGFDAGQTAGTAAFGAR